ncbi:uncharacterized protein LOC135421968 isoform X2 [Pseudopipra pipra]|uniref:uncharacterized protein LOC135421968 isoform X2 n=1 Tax=Pseudopipra pipra TaxID=415032 RepID=UPI00313A0979
MEIQLISGFLSLLFLVWLPTGTVSQTENSGITRQCKLEIWSKNLMVHVKWYEPKGLERWNQTNTTAQGENCTNLISPCMSAAHMGTCEFSISITRINSTDTENGTQETVPRCCLAGLQTNVTEKIWTGVSSQPRGCKSEGQEESSGKKKEEQTQPLVHLLWLSGGDTHLHTHPWLPAVAVQKEQNRKDHK